MHSWKSLARHGSGRNPTVGETSDQTQHARPRGADPDADVMGRDGPRVNTLQSVMAAFEAKISLAAPQKTDDLDRVGKRVDRFSGFSAWATHALDRIPETTRAETELEPSPTDPVDRRRSLRHYRWVAKGKVGDVGKEPHALSTRREIGDERERI